MSGLFQFTTRLAVETEARLTSAQRILEYCTVSGFVGPLSYADLVLAQIIIFVYIEFCPLKIRQKIGLLVLNTDFYWYA